MSVVELTAPLTTTCSHASLQSCPDHAGSQGLLKKRKAAKAAHTTTCCADQNHDPSIACTQRLVAPTATQAAQNLTKTTEPALTVPVCS